MMLPELQDIAEFDAPEFGVDLAFLGNDDSDERLYLQDLADLLDTPALEDYGSDLGKCAVKSGRSKQSCIRMARSKEIRRKKAAKETKKKQEFETAVQAEVQRRGGPSVAPTWKGIKLPRGSKVGGAPPRKALPIIRGKGRERYYPKRRPILTRGEKLRETLKAGLPESVQRGTVGFDAQQQRLAREDALNAISKRFRADIMPKLNAIYKMVDQSSLQTSATNEHNVIMNTQAYRRKVLNDMAIISARLPKGHPLRNKIAARRRSLGLY